jgi:hypothetical protein
MLTLNPHRSSKRKQSSFFFQICIRLRLRTSCRANIHLCSPIPSMITTLQTDDPIIHRPHLSLSARGSGRHNSVGIEVCGHSRARQEMGRQGGNGSMPPREQDGITSAAAFAFSLVDGHVLVVWHRVGLACSGALGG